MKKRWKWILAFVALAGAEWALSLKIASPVNWDEGWYCLTIRAWTAFTGAAIGGLVHGDFGIAFTTFFASMDGVLFMHTTAKPVYMLLEMAAYAVSGGRLAALSIPQAAAYAGTVLIIFQWAKEWASRESQTETRRVTAAATIAVGLSPFIVYFGATFLTNTVAGFFLTVGLYLIWRGIETRAQAVMAGATLAAAIMSHYSIGPTAVLAMVGAAWSSRRRPERLRDLLIAFLAPFLLVTAYSSLLAHVANARLVPDLIWSYARELREQFATVSAGHSDDRLYYFKRIVAGDGWPSLLLFMTSLFLLRTGSRKTRSFVALIWMSFILFSMTPTVGARSIVPILPIAYLFGTFGVFKLGKSLIEPIGKFAVPAAFCVILLFRVPFFIELVRFENPFREALRMIPSGTGRLYASTMWPVMSCIEGKRFYLPDAIDPKTSGALIDAGGQWSDAAAQAFLDQSAVLIRQFKLPAKDTARFLEEELYGTHSGIDHEVRVYKWP